MGFGPRIVVCRAACVLATLAWLAQSIPRERKILCKVQLGCCSLPLFQSGLLHAAQQAAYISSLKKASFSGVNKGLVA